MTGKIQVRAELAAELSKLDAWAVEHIGTKKYNPLEGWLRAYNDWDTLGSTFVRFLMERPGRDWSKRDIDLARRSVHLDWGHHLLFRSLTDAQLIDLLIEPYPDDAVRMYMLTSARRVASKKVRLSIFLHFFENDSSDAIRDAAFCSLATVGWTGTEDAARQLWMTNDEIKRIFVLDALHKVNSPLIGQYIAEALLSKKGSLCRSARAFQSIRETENAT